MNIKRFYVIETNDIKTSQDSFNSLKHCFRRFLKYPHSEVSALWNTRDEPKRSFSVFYGFWNTLCLAMHTKWHVRCLCKTIWTPTLQKSPGIFRGFFCCIRLFPHRVISFLTSSAGASLAAGSWYRSCMVIKWEIIVTTQVPPIRERESWLFVNNYAILDFQFGLGRSQFQASFETPRARRICYTINSGTGSICVWIIIGRSRSERVHFSWPPLIPIHLHPHFLRNSRMSANLTLESFWVLITRQIQFLYWI